MIAGRAIIGPVFRFLEVTGHGAHVGAIEEGTVVEKGPTAAALGIARYLAPVQGNV